MTKLIVTFRNFANALKTLTEVFIPRHGYNFFPPIFSVHKQNIKNFLNYDIY